MPIVLTAARLLLAGVFALAGLAKLADRQGSEKALTAFGIPGVLSRPLGIGLPFIELAVAIVLLPAAFAWFGSLGALSLLLVFVVAIAVNLARGRAPECHCFGQLHSAPAGWPTLMRNAGLASVAGLLVWQGRYHPAPSVAGWMSGLSLEERLAILGGAAAVLLLAAGVALLFQVLRQQGRLLLRLEALEARPPAGLSASPAQDAPAGGLAVGARAPGFRLAGLRGETMTLDALVAAGKPALLLFTNPNCGPCQALMPEVGRWQREHAALLTIALVSEGTAEQNRSKSAAHGVSQVLLQKKREVADMYQAWGTPAAVLVSPDGAVGSAVVQGSEAISALVAQAVAEPLLLRPAAGAGARGNGRNGNGNHPPPLPVAVSEAPKLGDRAPAVKVYDLDGNLTPLTGLPGRQTLLLFWNPGCGFCQQMLNDLRQWDADPPPGAPTLVVVSTGSAADIQAMKLRSPVLLDEAFQAGPAFGANGTPMAVLLDAKGRIASGVAAGAQAVLALAGAQPVSVDRPPRES